MVKVAGSLKGRILAHLADSESERIILAVMSRSRTAIEIEKETQLPQSTLYRKISELKECGLLMVESFLVRTDGKREATYACPFSEVRLTAVEGSISLEIVQTERSVEKRWFELFFSRLESSRSRLLLAASESSSRA